MAELVILNSDIEDDACKAAAKGNEAMALAEKIAAAARARAPVKTGNYRSGIIVQRTRTGARVFASDRKSAFVEFGVPNRGEPAQFVLRRAADSVGVKYMKKG